jgi:uncharacterized protein (TIGR03437 family)
MFQMLSLGKVGQFPTVCARNGTQQPTMSKEAQSSSRTPTAYPRNRRLPTLSQGASSAPHGRSFPVLLFCGVGEGVMRPLALFVLIAAGLARAQSAGPALTADVSAGRHTISPDIYGVNWYWAGEDPRPNPSVAYSAQLAAQASEVRATVRRWGGNNSSTYHWQFDVANIDADWFFEVLPMSTVRLADGTMYDVSRLPDGSTFNLFLERTRRTGAKLMGTIPILGWLPKERREMCSFDVLKYGLQCKQDPYARFHPITCGNGIAYDPACGDPSVIDGRSPANPVYIQNDPADAYTNQYDESFQAQWIQYLISRYGSGNQGGVAIWSLDNEPIWWDSTHRDIHPAPYTYDELLELNLRYAAAIKQADPTALVSGPVADNYASIWFSKRDIVAGWAAGNWYRNPVDRNEHGGAPLMAWYLQQFQNYEQQHGIRLLDYYDTHAYLAPGSTDVTRLESTREWWDPTYVVQGDYWIRDPDNNGAPAAPQLIPRLKRIINDNYPGTKLAITEYTFGALNTLNGALAQADILGIFGREGVDLATLWDYPRPTDPGAFAFRIYRNYDGIGGAFGETSVEASSADQSLLSVYAALRSDSMLTVMVINKTTTDLSSTLTLANFTAGDAARVWRYSGANLGAIEAQPDAAISGSSLTTAFPAYSMTMLVIPPASFAAPKPVVEALQSAASFDSTAFAPGQMVVVWGRNLGPTDLVGLNTMPPEQRVDSNGMVRDNMAGVRILFDGVPGRIVYVRQDVCAVVIPYFGATKATTHVQVEYQGVRSDPFEIPLLPTAPGLFTVNQQGFGQGAIQVDAQGTANSTDHPANPGSVAVLWLTGEGVTDPPGVDGRLAIGILPKPVAPVEVEIGGLPAVIEYAGAAPYNMPGLMQINARLDPAVQPGDQVPVRVRIGDRWSQNNVTLVVR